MQKNPYETAVALLARREHSRLELFQKLKAKNFSTETIEQTLDQVRDKGLQSDQRFVESYVHWRIQSGFGPRLIAMELKQRGVSEDLVTQYLYSHDRAFWKNRLQLIWQKRFKTKTKEPKAYAKQYRHLLHKGFEPDLIQLFLSDKNYEDE